jgi:regulator of nucleoside diphosphate kinase
MSQPKLLVNRLDRTRLEAHLADGTAFGPAAVRLRELMARAVSVSPRRVPPDVVTMNSRVVVRDGRGDEAEVYVLAYPEYDGPRPVYVLSPLGAALLAARVGERIQYMGASGARSAVVEAIEYQPERSGHLDL